MKKVYKLKDKLGEEVQGTFYPEEIQKITTSDDDLYLIEKVLRKRKKGSALEYLIKWRGLPHKFNYCIKQSEVVHYGDAK